MAADARLFRLNPFTENQLKTFLQRHHIPEKTGEISIAEREVALGRCEQFVEEMRGSGVLKLVCIPLLAQLTADQYFSSKNPGQVKWRRVDIYSKAVDDYLDKFDRVLEQNSSTIRGEVQGLLSKIDILFGDGLENPGKVKSRRREILRRFMEALSAHHLSNAQDPIIPVAHRILGLKLAAATSRTYLAVGALLEATGLIVDVHGQARFVHRTFAEFLGAASWDDRHGHDVPTPYLGAKRFSPSSACPLIDNLISSESFRMINGFFRPPYLWPRAFAMRRIVTTLLNGC
jgi:hypothetical protein